MRPLTPASFRDLRAAAPLFPATFAGRYFNIGRDRAAALIRSGDFPVEVISTGVGYRCTKTSLLRALGITPQDLEVLAEMEQASNSGSASAAGR